VKMKGTLFLGDAAVGNALFRRLISCLWPHLVSKPHLCNQAHLTGLLSSWNQVYWNQALPWGFSLNQVSLRGSLTRAFLFSGVILSTQQGSFLFNAL
jgi:hypothetical protein